MSEDQAITIEQAPVPRGPYVHARRHGGLVYVTGQIGRDAKTGEFVKGGFEAEFNQAIDNLEAILKAGGSSLDRVIRTMVMVVSPTNSEASPGVGGDPYSGEPDWEAMDAVFARRFQQPGPVRTIFGVQFLAAEPGHEVVR